MALFPEIDEKASCDKARQKLKEYRHYARLAGRPLTDLKSPSMDGMPKAQSFQNGTEAALVARLDKVLDAEAHLGVIDNALALCKFQSKWLLYFCYCTPEELEMWQVAERMGLGSVGTAKRQKASALFEFAESYPNHELIVLKNETSKQLLSD
ncbi:ArpU family phage packaging/lysis transcriptional regulator [Lacticaseibacillus jixiensis]|uniref:ArpU family phage packaging/lysis transcriptional regulator n=1 Tax=Lacticaseibacillus jixiensis TaxID=3231926 RepID=UPI0036F3A45F